MMANVFDIPPRVSSREARMHATCVRKLGEKVSPLPYNSQGSATFEAEYEELVGVQDSPIVPREFFVKVALGEDVDGQKVQFSGSQMHRCCYGGSCKPLYYTSVKQAGECKICFEELTATTGSAWLSCGHGPFCVHCVETGLGLVTADSYYMYRSGGSDSHARLRQDFEAVEKDLDVSTRSYNLVHERLEKLRKEHETLQNINIWERNKKNKAEKLVEKLEEENKQLKEYQAWAKKIIGEREETIQDLKIEIDDFVDQKKKQEEKNEQTELEVEELMKLKSSMENTLELTQAALDSVKNKLEVTRTASHVYQRGQKRRHEEYVHETSVLKHILSKEKQKFVNLTKSIESAVKRSTYQAPVTPVPHAMEIYPPDRDDFLNDLEDHAARFDKFENLRSQCFLGFKTQASYDQPTLFTGQVDVTEFDRDLALTNNGVDRDAYPEGGANVALGDAFLYRGREVSPGVDSEGRRFFDC